MRATRLEHDAPPTNLTLDTLFVLMCRVPVSDDINRRSKVHVQLALGMRTADGEGTQVSFPETHALYPAFTRVSIVYCAGPPGPIPSTHAILQRAELVTAADAGVSALVALLKGPTVERLPGPLRIVAVKAAGVLAVQRPSLIGRVLPCLLALAEGSSTSSASVCVPVSG